MPESFSAVDWIRYLASRWPTLAAAVSVAALGSCVGSQLLTKQFTSETRVLIEFPGAEDPRSALIVSPVYLDSLKSFELMATSPALFEEVARRLGLDDPNDPHALSNLRESAIDVEMARNTRMLSIRATLPDAAKAQALAEGLAEALVRRNEEVRATSAAPRVAAAARVRDAAAQRVSDTAEALLAASVKVPVAGLEAEIEALIFARGSVRDELRFAERRSGTAGAEALRARIAALDKEIESKKVRLARASAQREPLAAERDAARGALEEAESRLAHERSSESSRGEQLQIVDRGVAADRPSSPRVALNVIAGAALALLLALFALTVRYGLAGPAGQD